MASTTYKQMSVLTLSTAAFAVNFAVWTMFSVIGIRIKAELGLNETEFGLLVATPILTGSLVRLPLGVLTDRYGGRIVYLIQMLLVAIPTYGLAFATEYWHYLVIGLFVGLAGGSFAVGIAYTSAWFGKERQGTAMGIFGAGNAGAAITNLVAPIIVVALGWRAVPQIYSLAMLVMAVLFWLFTYPDPAHEKGTKGGVAQRSLAEQLAPLAEPRVWRFGLAYYFVFGGFVALALWLPKYYVGEFGLDIKTASFITLLFTLPSGVIRALGGWMSDRWGGGTITWWVFWVSLAGLFLLSYPPTTMIVHGIEGDISVSIGLGIVAFTFLVFVVGMAQGIGKASVYRSLADHYPGNMGAVGGLVGVIGGLGGFTLPIAFGVVADVLDVRSSCFMLMFAVLAGVMIWTWRAERSARDEILDAHVDVRDSLREADLLERRSARAHWIADWRPEDERFWDETGSRIAHRNLWLSMPALLLAFSIWMVWSVVVVGLPRVGFDFTTDELFWLAALPGLSGVFFRILYSFMVPIFGGRNWTVFSTVVLLIPAVWMGLAVRDPGSDYAVFVAIALLCGLGGGSFASSMANISFFFPKRLQGTALGLNAGIGNLGVSLVQLVVPLVIYSGAANFFGGDPQLRMHGGGTQMVWLHNAGFIWVPFIAASVIGAWFGMDNIRTARASLAEQLMILRRKHQWIMSFLYTGTFGSFLGLAASFPKLLDVAFPQIDAIGLVFVGPLLGSLARPVGGWLADRHGGAQVTFWTFLLMTLGMVGALVFLPRNTFSGSFPAFLIAFLVLFVGTGIGNGSTFRMIPIIFRTLHERRASGGNEVEREQAARTGTTEAAATLGFSSAIGAFGGFFIPSAFGVSIAATGGASLALIVFVLFYLLCMAVTWWWYARRGAELSC